MISFFLIVFIIHWLKRLVASCSYNMLSQQQNPPEVSLSLQQQMNPNHDCIQTDIKSFSIRWFRFNYIGSLFWEFSNLSEYISFQHFMYRYCMVFYVALDHMHYILLKTQCSLFFDIIKFVLVIGITYLFTNCFTWDILYEMNHFITAICLHVLLHILIN